MNKIPDWSRAVVQVPPGFWWVQIPAPQFPVKALSREWVLFNLKCVIFDIVKRWRYNSGSVFFDPLENRLSPVEIIIQLFTTK